MSWYDGRRGATGPVSIAEAGDVVTGLIIRRVPAAVATGVADTNRVKLADSKRCTPD
jgi:hypothetical protein